jgi:hypothetical protein
MKLIVACCATALAVTSSLASPAAASIPSARHCATGWTDTAKHAGAMSGAHLRHVSAGQHPCFDRLVLRLGHGRKPGYRVRYVSKIVQDGSGKPIHVRGHAKLQITALAPAGRHFPVGSHHLVDVTGFRTFRQVVSAGSFEGITTLGLGVRAKRPFRVFVLSGPGRGWRLVIDVAHRS